MERASGNDRDGGTYERNLSLAMQPVEDEAEEKAYAVRLISNSGIEVVVPHLIQLEQW